MNEAPNTTESPLTARSPATFHSFLLHDKIAILGFFVVIGAVASFILAPSLVRLAAGARPTAPDRLDYLIYGLRFDILVAGVLAAAWMLFPFFQIAADFLRSRWRAAYTVAALIAACGFLSVFIIHFGNRQFGGWDFSILVDSGWRQILGQRPYTDFITPNPPGFNLGIKYAFQLFGANWNAQLYFTSIFASASFLWIDWLLCQLTGSRLAAFCVALTVECAVVLPLCFWWYNNTVSIVATLFFLSCLVYASHPRSMAAQVSYAVSLTLLALMKPNTAGLVGICGMIFLIVSMRRRLNLAFLTVCAAAATFLVMQLSRISIAAMIASYRAAAIERGGFSRFGLMGTTRLEKFELLGWTLVVAAPLFSLTLPIWKHLQRRQWRAASVYLFFWAVLPITLYGMATDNEIKEVECGMLLAAGAVIAFGLRLSSRHIRRLYVAVVVAVALSGIYMGATRVRVFGIGPHQFFEWRDGNVPVANTFFSDTCASPLMRDVVREVAAAKSINKGPFFFGPRIEFMYAVVGVPSPEHLPVYWQPGTSFARGEEPKLIESWRQRRFNTLVFLKGDYTFYSAALLSIIDSEYRRDDSYPNITVYHAKNELDDFSHRGESPPRR